MPYKFQGLRQFLFISLACLGLVPESASAGLLALTDQIAIDAASSSRRGLKDFLADEQLYVRLITEMVPATAAKISKGAYKQVLRANLLEFVVEAKNLLWQRSDIEGFLSQMTSKKCGANVSCQVAFDLAPSQIGDFVDELSLSIGKGVDARKAKLNSQLQGLESEFEALAPNSAAAAQKNAEIEKLQREIIDLDKYEAAASKLQKPFEVPELSNLNKACRQ